VHVIFYDWFLKSSVGDSAWKQAVYNPTDPLEPMAPIQGEAFAMILLKNNYFAWLSEAKLRLKELFVTEYDTKKEKQNKEADAGLYFLGKCLLNFDVEVNPNPIEGDALPDMDKILLKPNGRYPGIYQQVLTEHLERMKAIGSRASKNPKYKEMKKGLQNMLNKRKRQEEEAEDSSDDAQEDEEDVEQEGTSRPQEGSPQRRKRRKILKSFREYTSANGEEGRFKGWSCRAGEDMAEYMETWSGPQLLYRRQLFWLAYRETYKQKQDALGKKKKPNSVQQKPPNYQKKVWGFDDVPSGIVQI